MIKASRVCVRLAFLKRGNILDKKERILWLDVLKGIGIISVVIGHIYRNDTVLNLIYSFHMPLFFFAGGWVYRKKKIKDDLAGRVKKIVIPYFIFGAIILIYWYFIERSFRSISQTLNEAALGLVLGEYKLLDFHSHLWFLPCFFVLAIFYNILVNIGGNKTAYIVSAVMAVIYIFVPLPVLPWGIDRVFQYIGYYAVGHLLSEIGADKFTARGHISFKLTGAIILMGGNFALAYFDLNVGVMWFVTAFAGIAGLSVISMLLERVKVLQYIGRISLVILCIHGPIYRVLCKLISIPLGRSTEEVRSSVILTLAVVVVTIALCALVYEILNRIAPWIIGEKKNKEKITAN